MSAKPKPTQWPNPPWWRAALGADRRVREARAIDLRMLEAQARDLGVRIGQSLPEGVGFTLLVFTYGDGGWLPYLSSAQRSDMIRTLREALAKLEAHADKPPIGRLDS